MVAGLYPRPPATRNSSTSQHTAVAQAASAGEQAGELLERRWLAVDGGHTASGLRSAPTPPAARRVGGGLQQPLERPRTPRCGLRTWRPPVGGAAQQPKVVGDDQQRCTQVANQAQEGVDDLDRTSTSSAVVGSSATTSSGPQEGRAMAARCSMPPDN
jgi:hypothetical protein